MFRQDRVGEFGKKVVFAWRVTHVRTGGLVVVERARLAHFAEADVGAFLVTVVETDKAAELERFTPRYGVFVAQAASSDRVIEPDVFDGAVLSEQLLELRLFQFRV